jgi:hypothetical protein
LKQEEFEVRDFVPVFSKQLFTKGWLVWGGGPFVLLLSAIAVLVETAFVCGFQIAHADLAKLVTVSIPIRVLFFVVEIVSTFAYLLLYFAMWFYWARVDGSRTSKKRIWFTVLLLGLWYGSCFYYFLVYRPQIAAFQKAGYGT